MPVIPLPLLPRYMRGRKAPKDLHHRRELAQARNLQIVRAFPPAPEPSWDSREHGWVGPVKDQAQCGSCWDFSGVGTIEIAMAKAGKGSLVLSEEYVLSCGNNGGCNGDDNTTVLGMAKANGLPLTSAYGPYNAGDGSPGQCAYNPGMQLFKIDDWGFADSNGGNGITPTDDIKRAIKATGCVGCAVAAGSSWDGYTDGVHTGDADGIDHDVILVGWQDDPSVQGGGWWWMRNSWSSSWGLGGYMKIAYGADSIGTEAVFALVSGSPTPPPGPIAPTMLQQVIDNFLDVMLAVTFFTPGIHQAVLSLKTYIDNWFMPPVRRQCPSDDPSIYEVLIDDLFKALESEFTQAVMTEYLLPWLQDMIDGWMLTQQSRRTKRRKFSR